MPKIHLVAATALLASVALPAQADMMFNRVATFPVTENLPADMDKATPTSSEIIAATEDGNTLVYSDSPLGAVGFIDITDPKAPKPAGIIKLEGEPTSVVTRAGKVFAGINTTKALTDPSGNLTIIDLASKTVASSCDLGGQPDSLALSKDGKFIAIAIENQRDEEVNDGALPQLPSGNLKIVPLGDGASVDCSAIKTVDVTGLADVAPEDAEPEFVAFNDANEIAVTMQENNYIVIVDAATAKVTSHFSAGKATLDKIDTKKDGAFKFTGKMEDVPREPDSVKWLDNDRIAIANEGDWKGGTRGFSIFRKSGEMVYDSGNSFEYAVADMGHYPDHRNKKGIEVEGIETGTYGSDKLLFVGSERASVIGVFKDEGSEPKLLQILPSGVGPEGLLAIPSRNLFVTANETDLGKDGLARSHVMIYERAEGAAAYPTITANRTEDGVPMGWGGLGSLTADPEQAGKLYATSDTVYANQPAIYTIDATQKPAVITAKTIVTRGGSPAQKLDIEGIAADGAGGFWLASEGNPEKLVPNAIYRVDKDGAIKEEIGLPAELYGKEGRFGFEGITMIGEGDDLTLVVAQQREWKGDQKGEVKLLAYKPKAKEWSGVRYPLEKPEKGWVGLSEIVARDGKLYVIERDNQIGSEAKLKSIQSVSLEDFKLAKLDGELPLVKKTLVRDLIPDLKSATNGYVVDKLEGLTIDKDGTAFVITDNDGVEDSSGETLFLNLGNITASN